MITSFICSTDDKTEIAGKGTVFYVPCPCDLAGQDDLVGTTAIINGKEYRVKGMEWWCIPRSPRRGEMIGLLVSDEAYEADMRIVDGLYGAVKMDFEGEVPLLEIVRFVRRAIEKERER